MSFSRPATPGQFKPYVPDSWRRYSDADGNGFGPFQKSRGGTESRPSTAQSMRSAASVSSVHSLSSTMRSTLRPRPASALEGSTPHLEGTHTTASYRSKAHIPRPATASPKKKQSPKVDSGKAYVRCQGTLFAVMHDHPVMGFKMTEMLNQDECFPTETTQNQSYPAYDAFAKKKKKLLVPYEMNADRNLNEVPWKGIKEVNPEPKKFTRFCRVRGQSLIGHVTGKGSRRPSVKETMHRYQHKHSHETQVGNNNAAVIAMNTALNRKRAFMDE